MKPEELNQELQRELILKMVIDVTNYIEEIEKGKKFRIRFKSIPGPPQTYTGFLKIKTNYPEKPEITVRIRGRIGKKS